MSKRTTKTARVTGDITLLEIFPDSSGAPCLVSYKGYRYAFDFLGELKCRLVSAYDGNRVANKIAREVCERTYLAALHAATTDEWFVANRELYLPEAKEF